MNRSYVVKWCACTTHTSNCKQQQISFNKKKWLNLNYFITYINLPILPECCWKSCFYKFFQIVSPAFCVSYHLGITFCSPDFWTSLHLIIKKIISLEKQEILRKCCTAPVLIKIYNNLVPGKIQKSWIQTCSAFQYWLN